MSSLIGVGVWPVKPVPPVRYPPMAFDYPPAHRSAQVDDYHGTPVADPYRWLEDPESEATRAFVAAQDELARAHLGALPERSEVASTMRRLWDAPRAGIPQHRSGVVVWTHNEGLADQPAFFVDRGAGPELLLDPKELSADGTVAITGWSLSPDGAVLAYRISDAGRDWQQIRFRSIATGLDLADRLDHVKFSALEWRGGDLIYDRFPETDHESVDVVGEPSVCRHRLGTPQSADLELFRNPDRPDLGYVPIVTDDERYLVLAEWEGTSTQMGHLYQRLDGDDAWTRLLPLGEASYTFLGNLDDTFLFQTDRDDPKGSIVGIDTRTGERRTVVPADDSPLAFAALVDRSLLCVHLIDAAHRLTRIPLDGGSPEPIPLPGPGTISGISGRFQDEVAFAGFETFTRPPGALRLHGADARWLADAADVASDVAVDRISATSTDGAEVGMFVIRQAGATLPAPAELYGYGGFSIDLTPTFDPARLAFVEHGGVAVVANLRGGLEHGETWHEQGMLGNKQQVFDDFIACAEHLVATGVTTPGGLGIRGRSNGGLLTAAAMLQRPDAFGAVVSQVPVTDMLRYQHFTAGRYWTVEYGDAADPEAFQWLIAYSPAHNVAEGTAYPPTLITTGETDDRVVPMHSYKFAAALQHAVGGRSERPVLLRIDRRAGHGLGKPTSKLIQESADVYGFLLHHLRP